MKTAVIYTRFSCSKQREASIEDQLRICRDWCAREGYRIVTEYSDRAISGRTDARPQFQLMMERAGESDIVLVYMMDRFSRDEYDAPIYKKRLRDAGVRVVSATESLPDGPEAVLIEKLYEGLAAVESAHISVRTKRGMQGNALKCLYNGDRVYGYAVDPETKRYVIDAEQAEVVREVFSRRAHGDTVNAIARSLAARGVKTYRGKPCSHTMVKNMLHNVRYKGVYKWGDVEVDGGMPVIIDADLWARAQGAAQKKRREMERWDDFAFTGKAVCGACGHNVVGTSGRGKNNVKYMYYFCGQRCGEVKPVPKDWLENHVAEALRELVSDREVALEIGAIVERYQRSDAAMSDLQRAQAAVREADAALANILKAIEQGIIAPGIQERINELQAEKERAQEFIAKSADYQFSAELFADFLQYASTLTDVDLIDLLVWQVVVRNDEIVVTLNYDTEPGVPQRFTLDGFLQDDMWVKKSPNTPGQEVFGQSLSGSPYGYLYETRSGLSVAIYSGHLAFVLKRAA